MTENLDDFVTTDLRAGQFVSLAGEHRHSQTEDWLFHETVSGFGGFEEGLNFEFYAFVLCARLVEPCGAFTGFNAEGGVVESLDLLPAFGVHL